MIRPPGRRAFHIVLTLLPVVLALLNVVGSVSAPGVEALERLIHDARLRANMARTADDRIVIVDIDERSLAEQGQWPWSRAVLARLIDEIFDRQGARALGIDAVFAEPDQDVSLDRLRELAHRRPSARITLSDWLQNNAEHLNNDAVLSRALQGRPVALGYYFTSDRHRQRIGRLPDPVSILVPGAASQVTHWDGYGASLASLAQTAASAGFFNAMADGDGSLRRAPMLAELDGHLYESLALATYRLASGHPPLKPEWTSRDTDKVLTGIELTHADAHERIPLSPSATVVIPYRGAGGADAGSFPYRSAVDLLQGRLPPRELQGKIVLLGFTAPGLMDLRSTPMGTAFPGVEVHANLISGLLDGRLPRQPDYAKGFEALQILMTGGGVVAGALMLPLGWLLLTGIACTAGLLALNAWLYAQHALALPVASSVWAVMLAVALNLAYGYFVEQRSRRTLVAMFGTYAPPEVVQVMLRHPNQYNMQARASELTILFCDIRGFTGLSEHMEPMQLQRLLSDLLNRLSAIIHQHQGTIDKYMGDCVMAFWGAPVAMPDHASKAVAAALDMVASMKTWNDQRDRQGLPAVHVGIGINTGVVSVGNMGSDLRRAYTVIGDAVNLASRLEGLSRAYGVDIVAGSTTRERATAFVWHQLDVVRVKGRSQLEAIHTPRGRVDATPSDLHVRVQG